MIWQGQYNAILFILFMIGLVIAFVNSSVEIGIATFVLILAIRIVVWIVNILFMAFLGRPLVYDVKILNNKRGADFGDGI